MRLHQIVTHSRVNGPGLRAVIFFQGCSLGCRHCFNPATHKHAGPELSIECVVRDIEAANRVTLLDGVTFSGGEPMEQARALAALVSTLKAALPQLSLGMYSGYTERELITGRFFTHEAVPDEAKKAWWPQIAGGLDFAVLGRYVAARPSTQPLRASRNQCLRLLSARYRESDFVGPELEVHFDSAGLVQLTGFPLLGLPVSGC